MSARTAPIYGTEIPRTDKGLSKLILASKSPRRRELLSMLFLDFEAVSADTDETVTGDIAPADYVGILSERKALACVRGENDFVIAADTVVALDGKIYGKPHDRAEAYSMLRAFSGREHSVYSGFTILHGDKSFTESVRTGVTFRELTDAEIYLYIDRCSPYDKAGAYGIQEFAGVFVSSVCGSVDNVVGLPVAELECAMRKEFSASLFDFMKNG